ncbi:MAG: methylmalonyl Co-A mutase-associated GTPase MeaB [Edaphobacter sp.]|uniref:methylmalonyl Co-A mutase-associated GTPase MeaB n=1 Tax=Edaphobacter sp. TaxID=1934404 RepID=UPI0023A3B518|nr:methylmalonyl Co-A mutase-associated GTPase MeaB [Edaphobacter sp.]MDE1177561.1 methylmalonyl Co-A mutase-associated GTPase MeaB [Edaphobacter sp.]
MIAQVNDKDRSEAGQPEEFIARLGAGDVRALARAISVVEDGGPEAAKLLALVRARGRRALRVGVTGAPGAGKSTLVDGLARLLVKEGHSVGVVAVDPTSAVTGGALLGDRIRMQAETGVYIRSMASRGALGGVARAAGEVCEVMEAAGRDVILLETVGVGQDEVAVAGLVDVVVLVLVPGMGDEVQSMKAGVMEAAEVYAVNKADRGGAEQVEAEIVAMQSLGMAMGWMPPVVRCSAMTGEGVTELLQEVRRCAAWKKEHGVAKSSMLGAMPGLQLDHLGVAVKSLATARGFYEALGLRVVHEEAVEHEQVRVAMLPLGGTRIELLEATAEDSVIGRFVAKRGEGLHHIAIKVESVDAMFARMKEQGVRLASDAVKVGAGGHRYFFVHPASTGGVLVEIVGNEEKGTD